MQVLGGMYQRPTGGARTFRPTVARDFFFFFIFFSVDLKPQKAMNYSLRTARLRQITGISSTDRPRVAHLATVSDLRRY